eukprot:TRINITY_DN106057_c0_g1_i1.p1 TRINITY_DN106057_c0_g1~~TRINITY_DN106057_c0_g1_i1.p1  ORF type:complete len:343 (+),score=61.68 TRINITY_DN106057_c0_g1_i1:161-1189(+)
MVLPTIASLFLSTPTLEAQLSLIALHAAFWWCFINWASKSVVDPFVKLQPWEEQWLQLNKQFFKNSFFTAFSSDADAFDFACVFQAILMQHFVGGVLCLPSTLGLEGRAFTAMACHGALCEAGWELQDIVTRVHQRLLQGEKGKGLNPLPLLLVVLVHHAMGQSMAIPMNLYYADNRDYHELVFLLQVAAFVALSLQSYGYTLNVKTKTGLFKIKVNIAISWLAILYSRVVRFAIVGYRLASTFYMDGNLRMLYVGISALVLMGLFNATIFLDATQKLVKFAKMPLTTLDAKPNQSNEHCDRLCRSVLLGKSHAGGKTQFITLHGSSDVSDVAEFEFCRKSA